MRCQAEFGAAVRAEGRSSITVHHSTFASNNATGAGTLIAQGFSRLALSDCLLHGNTVVRSGGILLAVGDTEVRRFQLPLCQMSIKLLPLILQRVRARVYSCNCPLSALEVTLMAFKVRLV